jgi:hypothetical protein
MVRRLQNNTGLRELLIADREYRLPGCLNPPPWSAPRGWPDELLGALKADQPVVVSSAVLMRALLHAGKPCADYCFGGQYYRANFLLDERDQLTEHIDAVR